ncbi:hypothetical protein GCM10011374_38030 [Kocuria dechangensis]|uniref:Uncharacterized protein n=1 Tax=Kocuria dechangensis TaxID=1176249 RepID=A0A917M0P1_9MICC|nr:hypothetical protein GCM10011374_38030 [Kocuria dechangensis]
MRKIRPGWMRIVALPDHRRADQLYIVNCEEPNIPRRHLMSNALLREGQGNVTLAGRPRPSDRRPTCEDGRSGTVPRRRGSMSQPCARPPVSA